jgi:uncharacterized protein with NRDE domain
MCLLVLAWRAHPRYPLIVAANRDEFHERPAAPLDRWAAPDDFLAGRDLRAGGTWLAVDGRRRFGVVTNFRDLQPPRPGARSRGELVPGFLCQPQPPGAYLAALEPQAAAYGGFNLLLAAGGELWYASNREESFARSLPAGIHGLSNQFLDTPWPKLLRVKRRFKAWLDTAPLPPAAALFDILGDRRQADDGEELPQTGLPPEWERTLSAPFVLDPRYGTRCSTVLLLESSGALELIERRFDPGGEMTGETGYRLDEGAGSG